MLTGFGAVVWRRSERARVGRQSQIIRLNENYADIIGGPSGPRPGGLVVVVSDREGGNIA